MGKTIQIRVDETLQDILARIQREVADNIKRTYGLNEVTIYGSMASQIAAARLRGQRTLDFRVKKIGLNKGIIELI